MNALLPIIYLGNIEYYSLLKNAENILLEKHEHHIKQTYRNRTEIYGANGKLKLIIPLDKRGDRTFVKDLRIDNNQLWQKLHWKSIESAYRSSPYFEYYEHEFIPFYKKEFKYLIDYNLQLQERVLNLLEISVDLNFTESYQKEIESFIDYRSILNPKSKDHTSFSPTSYMQVFEPKHGFIPNLSIIDLLFNEGPNAESFL